MKRIVAMRKLSSATFQQIRRGAREAHTTRGFPMFCFLPRSPAFTKVENTTLSLQRIKTDHLKSQKMKR